ncbi:hypothetical protein HPB47_007173 [Ixodes persulcatus]|uniref:Uncharacterized protein n=1 Tax=Ixodes persulcatus TaxID=34615 RepID=A0AC60P8Z3_IXOPE|nr:hypothetical protein HPB47_007173 [Ixodes persulcatus]
MESNSPLRDLNAYLDKDGVLRVGGNLSNADMERHAGLETVEVESQTIRDEHHRPPSGFPGSERRNIDRNSRTQQQPPDPIALLPSARGAGPYEVDSAARKATGDYKRNPQAPDSVRLADRSATQADELKVWAEEKYAHEQEERAAERLATRD